MPTHRFQSSTETSSWTYLTSHTLRAKGCIQHENCTCSISSLLSAQASSSESQTRRRSRYRKMSRKCLQPCPRNHTDLLRQREPNLQATSTSRKSTMPLPSCILSRSLGRLPLQIVPTVLAEGWRNYRLSFSWRVLRS